MSTLKTIQYRGRVAEFVIPAHWHAEYEPTGGGTFYEDASESGTLRLNVLGFESTDTPAEQMAERAFRDGVIERTSCGFPIQREESIKQASYSQARGEAGESACVVRAEQAVQPDRA